MQFDEQGDMLVYAHVLIRTDGNKQMDKGGMISALAGQLEAASSSGSNRAGLVSFLIRFRV